MDINATLQTWINVLTHPSEATFAEEQSKPQANFTTAIIWMVITGVIAGIMGWLSFTLFFGSGNGFLTMLDQMNLPPEVDQQMREMLSSGMMGNMAGGSAFGSIVMTPIFFLLGTGLFYLIGRLFGGRGDLGRYAYLLASFQAPIGIIGAVLGLVPVAGTCLSVILSIYGLVLTYFATKVELNLTSGRAIGVILTPLILFFALMICFAVTMFGLISSMQNQ